MANEKTQDETDAIEWAAFLLEIEAEEEQKRQNALITAKVIQFPQKRRQIAVEEKKFCYDCEWKGRVIAVDPQGASWVFRCHCKRGDEFTNFPVYDKQRSGFNDARAAR